MSAAEGNVVNQRLAVGDEKLPTVCDDRTHPHQLLVVAARHLEHLDAERREPHDRQRRCGKFAKLGER